MRDKITIALDMMSGDLGVASSVPAAISCIEEIDDIFLILIGDKKSINTLLPSNMKLLDKSFLLRIAYILLNLRY